MVIDVIIPAAGIGSRFSDKIKKQFFLLKGKPVFYHTLKRLNESYSFDKFLIGASENDFEFIKNILFELEIKNFKLIPGGKERKDTVFNCLNVSNADFVLIHDAVRPFVKKEVVVNTIEKSFKTGAAICGLFVKDTVKKVINNKITETINRDFIFLAHTPQVFDLQMLKQAMNFINENNIMITDEAQAVELLGKDVGVVLSNKENIKITVTEDIENIY